MLSDVAVMLWYPLDVVHLEALFVDDLPLLVCLSRTKLMYLLDVRLRLSVRVCGSEGTTSSGRSLAITMCRCLSWEARESSGAQSLSERRERLSYPSAHVS